MMTMEANCVIIKKGVDSILVGWLVYFHDLLEVIAFDGSSVPVSRACG